MNVRILQSFTTSACPLLLALMLTLTGFLFGVFAAHVGHAQPMIQVPADEFMEMVESAK